MDEKATTLTLLISRGSGRRIQLQSCAWRSMEKEVTGKMLMGDAKIGGNVGYVSDLFKVV